MKKMKIKPKLAYKMTKDEVQRYLHMKRKMSHAILSQKEKIKRKRRKGDIE